MKYLPIIRELFASDSMIFMLIGLVFAACVGIKMNDTRKSILCLVSSFVLYAVCELVSNLHTNYIMELMLLFVGTLSIGAIIGFLISLLVMRVRQR